MVQNSVRMLTFLGLYFKAINASVECFRSKFRKRKNKNERFAKLMLICFGVFSEFQSNANDGVHLFGCFSFLSPPLFRPPVTGELLSRSTEWDDGTGRRFEKLFNFVVQRGSA